jgi:Family of unknown function (DUF6348)
MDSTIQAFLLQLFARHGIELEVYEEWLIADGDFPAIRGFWNEGKGDEPGRLDIDVVLDEERRIEESFPGIGRGETGCLDALEVFARNDFHVLLAACWQVADDRQLTLRPLDIGGRIWEAYVGHFALRGIDALPETLTSRLLEAIEDTLGAFRLEPELHWIRFFYGNDNGDVRVEALMDNELWPKGEKALTALPWPKHDAAYSARGLIALEPRD